MGLRVAKNIKFNSIKKYESNRKISQQNGSLKKKIEMSYEIAVPKSKVEKTEKVKSKNNLVPKSLVK